MAKVLPIYVSKSTGPRCLTGESFVPRPTAFEGRHIFELPEPAFQKKWWDGPGIILSFDELNSIANSFFALGSSMSVFIDFCLGISSKALPTEVLDKVVELDLLSGREDQKVPPRVRALALAIDQGMSGKTALDKLVPVDCVLDFLRGNRLVREQSSELEVKSHRHSDVSLDSFRVRRTLDDLKKVFLAELHVNILERNRQSIVENVLESTLKWHASVAPRHNGEKSATHPIYCALSLLRLGVVDPGVISVSLLHDILEDTKYCFPETERKRALSSLSASDIRAWGFKRLLSDFRGGFNDTSSVALAYSVIRLSKNAVERSKYGENTGVDPYVRELCLLPEQLTVERLLAELNDMGAMQLGINPTPKDLQDIIAKVTQFVMLSKVADRRDNLRSIERYCPEKIEKKLFETTEYLLPSFRRTLPVVTGELEIWHSLERARICLEEITTSEVQELKELVERRRREHLQLEAESDGSDFRNLYRLRLLEKEISWLIKWLARDPTRELSVRSPNSVT